MRTLLPSILPALVVCTACGIAPAAVHAATTAAANATRNLRLYSAEADCHINGSTPYCPIDVQVDPVDGCTVKLPSPVRVYVDDGYSGKRRAVVWRLKYDDGLFYRFKPNADGVELKSSTSGLVDQVWERGVDLEHGQIYVTVLNAGVDAHDGDITFDAHVVDAGGTDCKSGDPIIGNSKN